MALQKTLASTDNSYKIDFTDAYFKIDEAFFDADLEEFEFSVRGYANKSARDTNQAIGIYKKKLIVPLADVASIISTGGYGLSKQDMKSIGYEYMKTLSEWSTATDVLDPTIRIKQGTTIIENTNGSYDFENTTSGSSSSAIEFTIENIGDGTLNLTGDPDLIAISGDDASEFSINETSTTATVATESSTSFTVTFSPTTTGSKSATISISSDDAGQNPFTFDLNGTGV